MDKIMGKFADFVIRHRLLVLCIIGAITLAFGWQMSQAHHLHQLQ